MSNSYVVATHYSHTDKRLLWKILTRPIDTLSTAETYRDVFEQEDRERNPTSKKKFFIIEIDKSDY